MVHSTSLPTGHRVVPATIIYKREDDDASLAAIAGADDSGRGTAHGVCGEAAIMARYMGEIAVFRPTIPLDGEVPEKFYNELPRKNFIDSLVWKKLQRLRITPSQECSDEKYLRRVYIDIIGSWGNSRTVTRKIETRS